MAETTVTGSASISQAFLDWLKNSPAALAKFIQILKEFYAIQGKTTYPYPPPASTPGGPVYIRPDQPPGLLTVPITSEELDAMMEDRADAQVKEKALEWAKGFLTGVLVTGAGA